jgi:periplasmic protein CpxP/Spy
MASKEKTARSSMKVKSFSLKSFSLIAGIVAISLASAANIVKADVVTNGNNNPIFEIVQAEIAQAKEKNYEEKWEKLGLTDAQKTELRSIKDSAKQQIQQILTPEQRQQYDNAIKSGQNKRQAFASLNITEQQKTQIKEIKDAKKAQIEALLTPEQKQQLQQMKDNWRSRRQSNNLF